MATTAQSYAQQQADLLRQQLANLYTGVNTATSESTNAATTRKQALLDTINANKSNVESAYGTSAKEAYTNKMLGGKTLSDQLQRLGLSNTGYGVGQQLQNENVYGQNLEKLQSSKATSLGELALQENSAEKDYTATLADIQSEAAKNRMSIDQYVNEQVQSKYQQEYENKTAAEQQAIENAQNWAQINQSAAAAKEREPQTYTNQAIGTYETGVKGVLNSNGKAYTYTTANGDKYTLAKGVNPWTGTVNPDAKGNGNAFSNGYQPNNVKGAKLSKTGSSVPVNGQTQNVWKTGKKYYVWDGTQNTYLQVKQSGGNWVVK